MDAGTFPAASKSRLNSRSTDNEGTEDFEHLVKKKVHPVLVPLLMPFMKFLSTPKRAARVITKVLIDASGQTCVYYDEGGHPMLGSALVRDPKFQDRVVAETRELLAKVPASSGVDARTTDQLNYI
jgi:hypothetical protein